MAGPLMINVATVHFQTGKWIDPQLRYLEANIPAPFRVFASLEGIDDPALRGRFHAVEDGEGGHPDKLNALAKTIAAQSAPDDVLLFIDGDAFPVRPLVPWIDEVLRDVPLAAVRREENAGDPQPHPCFCVTTVGFWTELGGDWSIGSWTGRNGREVSDVGGVLLHQLEAGGTEWYPMLRTNTTNPHPLWFAVYDHKIYHHGAGFRRRPISRIDVDMAPEVAAQHGHERTRKVGADNGMGDKGVGDRVKALVRQPSTILQVRPHHVTRLVAETRKTAAVRWRHWMWLRRRGQIIEVKQRYEEQSEHLFARLNEDPGFYRELDP